MSIKNKLSMSTDFYDELKVAANQHTYDYNPDTTRTQSWNSDTTRTQG